VKQVINFVRESLNDFLVYEGLNKKGQEYCFDYEMRINSHLVYGSVLIAENKDGLYQIFESDISIPYREIEIPKALQSCIELIDIHDWGEDQHFHFVTKKPLTLPQLKAVLKFFFKLYLFAKRDTATF